jgi:1,4-alpha-glucan branching enzyme
VSTTLLSEQDLFLFNEGSHVRLYEHMGAHLTTDDGVEGAHFAVWAPSARAVTVRGDFNGWDRERHPLARRGESGIWEGFVPGVEQAATYKFHVVGADGRAVDHADPFAAHTETPPANGSKVWDLAYEWGDDEWMANRGERQAATAPISIYEMHLGSWQRGEDGERYLTYREMAPQLIAHLDRLHFTHVEFLPVMEHPYEPSWGYQTTGYFAPTSRFGTPQDFMYLVDQLHQAGYGVILDWVPSHFPTDEWALAKFDGTHLYEHADPRQGFHPDWKSAVFNYGRHEVRSFLLSSALSWLDRYHVDGLRVDAVASMLYLDYSRDEGEWIPNAYGGNENLEAIAFLRRLNEEVYGAYPDAQTFAEESTAWPGVSRPTYTGGLGFGFKWDMGWMHDSLDYLSMEPIHRKFHHNQLTFRGIYMDAENYCLPLSHDEVVHGKGSLLDKMPGDDWQQRANLRLLLGHMFCQPGKKLLFMGGELGVRRDWSHERGIDWSLVDDERHAGILRWTSDLAAAYRDMPALHELDTDPRRGFEWVDATDEGQSVVSYLRRSGDGQQVLVACNFTPVPRHDYRIGVPADSYWREVLNSDANAYGGSDMGNMGGLEAEDEPVHGHSHSLALTLPPLAILVLAPEHG